MLPTKLRVPDLLLEAQALVKKRDDTGVMMAFGPATSVDLATGLIREAISEISGLRGRVAAFCMVNVLPAGCIVPVHTDTLPVAVERWHLVLSTNAGCSWWDEAGGEVWMAVGYWYGPLPYWLPHKVSNVGGGARVHLVVDLFDDSFREFVGRQRK